MNLFKFLIVLFISVNAFSSAKKVKTMGEGLKLVKAENPNFSDVDLKFIESALQKAKVIVNFKELKTSHLRLFIQADDKTHYSVHIGSSDPYSGGSGANYSVEKSTGKVTLESTETFAPVPKKGEE